MAIEIVDFPIKNDGSFHSYVTVYQRVSREGHDFIIPIIYPFYTVCLPMVRSISYHVKAECVMQFFLIVGSKLKPTCHSLFLGHSHFSIPQKPVLSADRNFAGAPIPSETCYLGRLVLGEREKHMLSYVSPVICTILWCKTIADHNWSGWVIYCIWGVKVGLHPNWSW